jgi:carbamate kinase
MPHAEGGPGTVVIAVGGNALQPPEEIHADIHAQFAHTRTSLAPVIALAAQGWRIALVHGNGPLLAIVRPDV